MKQFFFNTLSALHQLTVFFSKMTGKLFPRIAARWNAMQITYNENKITRITHASKLNLAFYTPNALTRYRADTFSTKEPETLEWIDKYGKQGGVFFDIGANVGLYSIYHAKTKAGATYSFEPSVFNLKLLVKNINLNECQDKIKIISNPLTAFNSFADFNLQSTVDGGALSSFGVDYGHDGKKMNTRVSYQTLGFSLDYLIEHKMIPDIPSIIKVDVDGIEHLILRGAQKLLAHPDCRSILIEVNDAFTELASEVSQVLTSAGFILLEKRAVLADNMEATGNFTYNQIWVK